MKTVTKLDCIQAINHLALHNHVSLVWVPSHSGIAGNKHADELANIGAALETDGPDPAPPIALSVIKAATKDWVSHMFFLSDGETPAIASQLKKYWKLLTSSILNTLQD